jgi:sugar lactone lactonase YvrE
MNPAVHLGYWNTTPVPNGQYYLKLTASDSAGHLSSCSTWVMVQHGRGGGMSRQGPSGGGTGVGEGSLYVGSADGTVLHLSDDLDSLGCWQVSDSGSQAYVTSVLEVGSDSVLVLDARNKRVHKLHRNGQGRRRLVSNLSLPMGLTRDDDGNFWLVDKGLHRIGKFRSNGTLVFTRGGLGTDSLHFHSPEAIAVKGSLVYVADTKNDRIVAYDTSGNYKANITGDFENPTSVFVADSGAIYLTDGSDGMLKGITPLGGNIATIVSPDSDKLRGLVASDNGHWLFTLAPQPNKVYKLQIVSDENLPGGVQSSGGVMLPKTLSFAQPFPNPARTRLNIAYALPRATRVSVRLYDAAGKLVNTLASGDKKPGYYSLTWNRQDTKGRTCACGVYFCTLSAENQRLSRKVILTE